MRAGCQEDSGSQEARRRGGGGGTHGAPEREEGERPITYKRIINKTIEKLLDDPSIAQSYSSIISFIKWAFKAHLKVILFCCNLISGARLFQINGKAYRVDFLKVSVLG
jgi:hypothetical protein